MIERRIAHRPLPLPGTAPPARGLFIDRWGTLLERPRRGWCARFDDARFTPRAVETLFRAAQGGWKLYLVGNEDQVARGRVSDSSWQSFQEGLSAHLTAQGVHIQRDYACLDNPHTGLGRHKRDSVYLLPNTGAMYHAMQHDGISIADSWTIGDSTLELTAGWRAGSHIAGVLTGEAVRDESLQVEPEILRASLAEAVAEILAGVAAAR